MVLSDPQGWNVRNAHNKAYMFDSAQAFDEPLNHNGGIMNFFTTLFNQSLVRMSFTNLNSVSLSATALNQEMNGWDVGCKQSTKHGRHFTPCICI